MTHDPDRYAKVHGILNEARLLDGTELGAYLDSQCGGDEELRAEVLGYIEAGRDDHTADPFGDEELRGARKALEGVLDPTPSDWLPERVGEYRVLRQIGRGGMGVVYEAEQAAPHRRVAIKLLHPSSATPERLKRFKREAALLGRLQHPGIAQIYEAGTYDVGRGPQPFFAMELIDGVDIRAHCERQDLSRSERIELLARVADAIQHAHEREVIHRDLKPDNVLVDARGNPRILDFGVAHTNIQSTTLSSVMTQEGQLVGTLAYMAPEQLGRSGGEASPRVDVFALGVLGFELLLGRLPREVADIPLPQIVAHLAQSEPVRAGALDPSLRGDVETILGKALETDRFRRYESAAAFAADLRRHLANEPIRAHPPTSFYLARKFIRRNRALVLGAPATLTVAVLGAVVATSYALEANRRANEVEIKAAELERRTSDVLRLSLIQDYEDLMSSVKDLWPPHPDRIGVMSAWVSDAEHLTAQLTALRSKRDELTGLATPQTDEERQADRERHPEYLDLVRAQGELIYRQRLIGKRRDGIEIEVPPVPPDLTNDPAELHSLAWPLVQPSRTHFGEEPLGVALAERALDSCRDDQRSMFSATLSKGYFAIGRDEDALGLAYMALDEAPTETEALRRRELAAMETATSEAVTPEGFAFMEGRIAELEESVVSLENRVNSRRTWTFSEELESKTRARWWYNQLDSLIGKLEALTAERTGLLTEDGITEAFGWSVGRRLAFARDLKKSFATTGAFDRRWADALPEIHARYPDIDLTPQMGLVPIGPDRASGLWEFWHVQSGAEPPRDADGKIVLNSESGCVFVLIPGGTFWMGAQKSNPNGRNYDKDARSNEGPVHEVEVSPFFLSKFELTQEQWERAMAINPSRWTEDTLKSGWLGDMHPVEQVNWWDCMVFVGMQGLTLPTEAQWEYACRAGRDGVRPFEFDRLPEHANLADQAYVNEFPGATFGEPWDDGIGGHGPVGSLLPNDFGLHDMIGNVWEWCLDGYDRTFYQRSPSKDPFCPSEGAEQRTYRGGGAINPSMGARTGIRYSDTPHLDDIILSLRPARSIEP